MKSTYNLEHPCKAYQHRHIQNPDNVPGQQQIHRGCSVPQLHTMKSERYLGRWKLIQETSRSYLNLRGSLEIAKQRSEPTLYSQQRDGPLLILVIHPMNGLTNTNIYNISFLICWPRRRPTDLRNWTYGYWRRIRIWGRRSSIIASRPENLGKSTPTSKQSIRTGEHPTTG